jgi:hypothetical protein
VVKATLYHAARLTPANLRGERVYYEWVASCFIFPEILVIVQELTSNVSNSAFRLRFDGWLFVTRRPAPQMRCNAMGSMVSGDLGQGPISCWTCRRYSVACHQLIRICRPALGVHWRLSGINNDAG